MSAEVYGRIHLEDRGDKISKPCVVQLLMGRKSTSLLGILCNMDPVFMVFAVPDEMLILARCHSSLRLCLFWEHFVLESFRVLQSSCGKSADL